MHNSLGIATLGMPHSLGVASGSDKPPNFVIILLDDSGCSDFNFPANSTYPTPNVERLVGQIP